jgi:hypothetical protein
LNETHDETSGLRKRRAINITPMPVLTAKRHWLRDARDGPGANPSEGRSIYYRTIIEPSRSGTGDAYNSEPNSKEGAHMLGGLLVTAFTGLVLWKYRDSLLEYVKGNAEPVRETVDGLLRTVQQTSETLLDQAKEQVSSRLGTARERLRAGASNADRGRPTE